MPAEKVVSLEDRAKAAHHELQPVCDTPLPLIWARDADAMINAGYVVKGIIGRGELIVIYGAPKSGKTFLATDMAMHVASGRDWFGNRVKAGFVIYIAAEMGRRSQRRVRAWLSCHLSDADEADIPLAIVPQVVNLLEAVPVARLDATIEALIAERGTPALIVIDTLSRSIVGGDENTSQDMGKAISVCDTLRDRFDAATILVHHSGKDTSKGSRGSSSLLGAADTYVRVEADNDGGRVAEIEWCRDGPSGQRFGFRLNVVDLGVDLDGDMVTSCVVASAEAPTAKPKAVRRDVALDALAEAVAEHGQHLPETSTIPKGTNGVTLDQWRDRWVLRTGYEGASGGSIRANFHKDKDALLKTDKVGISKPYVWINR